MEFVRSEVVEDGIVLVTIDRQERMNALGPPVLSELHQVVDTIDADPEVRVVIVTGAGKAFSSGADVKGGENSAPDGSTAGTLLGRVGGHVSRMFLSQEHMAGLFEKIHRLRQPVIAAVNGPAVGGGFALALACDLRVAVPGARFGAIFISRGVSACDMGTSYLLPRLVGAARAAELMLTGRVFDADEAREMSLVVDVVPPDRLIERCTETARLIASNSPLAVWMTKEVMWQTIDSPSLRHALDLENRTQIMCSATGELDEAFAAFRERRTPRWQPL
jgi:enoyl-CoA hydratase/carnithine racemase